MEHFIQQSAHAPPAPGPTTVYAVVAQPILANGLAHILNGIDDVCWAGASEDCETAVSAIDRIRPRVLLIDHAIGWRNVTDLVLNLGRSGRAPKIVIWAKDLSAASRLQAFDLGITGILDKSLPSLAVVECVRAVAADRRWTGSEVETPSAERQRGALRLTSREREIVALVKLGLKNREIADRLSITSGTVKVHLMHIFEKTGARDRFELGVQAVKLLEVSPKEPRS